MLWKMFFGVVLVKKCGMGKGGVERKMVGEVFILQRKEKGNEGLLQRLPRDYATVLKEI